MNQAQHTPLERVVAFYETISPERLPELASLYTEQAYFKDPFNEVEGSEAILAIFRHMYATTREPRFRVERALASAEAPEAFLIWVFEFSLKNDPPGKTRRIRGASHLRFAEDGRVSWHRDYWDAAEELYETLPLLGGLMRWLKRRMRA